MGVRVGRQGWERYRHTFGVRTPELDMDHSGPLCGFEECRKERKPVHRRTVFAAQKYKFEGTEPNGFFHP